MVLDGSDEDFRDIFPLDLMKVDGYLIDLAFDGYLGGFHGDLTGVKWDFSMVLPTFRS